MEKLHTEVYFTSVPSQFNKYKDISRRLGFNTKCTSEYEAWKAKLRNKLADITGINRMVKCDLLPRLLESKVLDGYRRDKVLIQTEPEIWMPFYILVPDGMKHGEKRPCIISPHGHDVGGKEGIAGRKEIPAVKAAVDKYNYDYGLSFVREGYIVFCPDARGIGERREFWMQGDEDEKMLGSSCSHLNNVAISMGFSLAGMWTWDLMRLLDYIQTQPFCDSNRIACCGFSGGGMQTLWLSAMDDRVKCSIISGYFYGFRDSLIMQVNCGCNYVPHLWEYADAGDLGALIAPRPLLIESGRYDPLNGARGIDNVMEQLEITRRAYKLLNSEDKLDHHIFPGQHRWNGEKAMDFIGLWL